MAREQVLDGTGECAEGLPDCSKEPACPHANLVFIS